MTPEEALTRIDIDFTKMVSEVFTNVPKGTEEWDKLKMVYLFGWIEAETRLGIRNRESVDVINAVRDHVTEICDPHIRRQQKESEQKTKDLTESQKL